MEKPILRGVYWCDRNRFSHDFDRNPTPQRSELYPQLTADLPVVCDFCGRPFWPPPEVVKGCCSEMCTRQYQDALKTDQLLLAEEHAAEVEAQLSELRLTRGIR